jgi:hypothetical protein
MATKKACVIFTAAKQSEADAVSANLQEAGYEVCMAEVAAAEAAAVKAGQQGSLPAKVQGCLDGAEVCVILMDEAADFGGIGGLASDGGCRVITVGGNPEDLPEELDDIIDGHLPSPDSPDLVDVVEGEPERVRPDNEPASPRKPPRVKCQ